jgi:PAS domain S-box-containing protein
MTADDEIWLRGLGLLEQQIAVLDANGMIMRVNHAWAAHARSLGLDQPKWDVGARLLEAFSSGPYAPAARTGIAAALRAALVSDGTAQSIAYTCDDVMAPRWSHLSFCRYSFAGQAYVLARHEDISVARRLEAEREHQITQAALRALVAEHTDQAVMILDANGLIEWVNPGFTQLLGYTPGEVIGKTPRFLNGLETDVASRRFIERRIREGASADAEVLHYTKAGTPLWIRTEIRPVRNAPRLVEHFVVLVVDITESKRSTDLLAREHELLNTIVNGVPQFIVWKDRDLVLRGCNQQYARISGLASPHDIVGKTVEDLPAIAKFADRYNQIDRQIIQSGIPALRLRETVTLPSGEERVLIMNRMPLRRRDKTVSGILAVSEDVTDDERAAQKIRDDEERWMLALEVNQVAVWDFDAAAKTVVGSKRWTELLGDTANTLNPLDMPLPAELIHADELARFTADWNALLSGALPGLETGIRLRVGDSYRYMRLRGQVVRRDSGGKARRVVGTMVDIHEARLMQIQAANASKLESIGQLAAGIAHEINTPTQYVGDNVKFLGEAFESVQQCVAGLVTLMAAHGDTVPADGLRRLLGRAELPYLWQEIPKAVTQSLDGIQRIAKIVGAMKEFSHPGQDRTPTDINHAILNAITVATNEWKYVARVETDLDPTLPPVPVMPGEFNQVILNIVVNAAQAIAEASAHAPATDAPHLGTIRVVTRQSSDWAEIQISDDGCGMPRHIQDRIFDPFFTTKPVGRGTGQGLSIAHNVIAQKHRGTISVVSEPGRGTTFTIRLPLATTGLAESAA